MTTSIFSKIAAPLAAVALAGSMFAAMAPSAGAAFYPTMSPPEYQFLAMLNGDRAANGEGPLTANGTLSGLARQRSQSMVAGTPFSHYDGAGTSFSRAC